MPSTSGFILFASLFLATTAQYSATYLPSNAPPTTEQGQVGTNQCGTALNQTSMCQNAYSERAMYHIHLMKFSLV